MAGKARVKGLIFMILCLFLEGCAGKNPGIEKEREGGPLKVVVTLFPYYDFTRQIAGDMVDLELIVPAGMDSHSFEPTPADMRKIEEADVLIMNGGAMEHWVREVLKALEPSSMTVVVMMDYVDAVEEEIVEGMEEETHDHSHDKDHDSHDQTGESKEKDHEHEPEYDEHIWTSPVNAMACTDAIAEALSKADPCRQKEYEAGRDRYEKELLRLHEGFLEVAENRKRNTIIVGDKFPFRYLADEYGFDYRAAFSGCSTDTEPSARTIAYLIDKVREEQLPVVYYLELSSPRVSEIISEETGADMRLLHSCHNVTRKELEDGITYVELMEQNIENLRKGLDE